MRCSVLGCKSDSETKVVGLSFHKFPEKPELRNLWIAATGIIDWVPKNSSKICCQHFDRTQLIKKGKKTYLYPDAVPIQATTSQSSANVPRSSCYQRKKNDNDQASGNDGGVNSETDSDDTSLYATKAKLSTGKLNKSGEQNPDTESVADKNNERHAGYQCGNCSCYIVGYRYTCVQCPDYDMCGSCEARGAHCLHYVLRIPRPKPYMEIQSVISKIRMQLGYFANNHPVPSCSEPDSEPVSQPVDQSVSQPVSQSDSETSIHMMDSIKIEIKEEIPDPLEYEEPLESDYNYIPTSTGTLTIKPEPIEQDPIKQEQIVPEEPSQQTAFKTTTASMMDNTIVIIENPVLPEPANKRRRTNSPSLRLAPTPSQLAPTPQQLATSRKAGNTARPTAATSRKAGNTARLAPETSQLAQAPDLAPDRMLDNIILYRQLDGPPTTDVKDELVQVFLHANESQGRPSTGNVSTDPTKKTSDASVK